MCGCGNMFRSPLVVRVLSLGTCVTCARRGVAGCRVRFQSQPGTRAGSTIKTLCFLCFKANSDREIEHQLSIRKILSTKVLKGENCFSPLQDSVVYRIQSVHDCGTGFEPLCFSENQLLLLCVIHPYSSVCLSVCLSACLSVRPVHVSPNSPKSCKQDIWHPTSNKGP